MTKATYREKGLTWGSLFQRIIVHEGEVEAAGSECSHLIHKQEAERRH